MAQTYFEVLRADAILYKKSFLQFLNVTQQKLAKALNTCGVQIKKPTPEGVGLNRLHFLVV